MLDEFHFEFIYALLASAMFTERSAYLIFLPLLMFLLSTDNYSQLGLILYQKSTSNS